MVNDPQPVCSTERGGIVGALLPPIGRGLDHYAAGGFSVVSVAELFDPVDHCSWAQVVTVGRVIRPTCPICK